MSILHAAVGGLALGDGVARFINENKFIGILEVSVGLYCIGYAFYLIFKKQ